MGVGGEVIVYVVVVFQRSQRETLIEGSGDECQELIETRSYFEKWHTRSSQKMFQKRIGCHDTQINYAHFHATLVASILANILYSCPSPGLLIPLQFPTSVPRK